MISNNCLAICQYKDCNLIYEKPVILPCCGESLCERHVENLRLDSNSDTIKCFFCLEEFIIPDKGLILNKALHKLTESIYFGVEHKNAKISAENFEKSLSELSLMIKNPANFLNDYFNEIKNQIDLQRETIILSINKYYDKIMKSIKETEKSCNESYFEDNYKYIKDQFEESSKVFENSKIELRENKSSEDSWKDLKEAIDKNESKINKLIHEFKEILLMGQSYNFVSGNLDLEKDKNIEVYLGKINSENINDKALNGKCAKACNQLNDSFSSITSTLITFTDKNEIRLWKTNVKKYSYPQYEGFKYCIALSDKEILALSSEDGLIFLLKFKNEPMDTFLQESIPVCLLRLNDSEFFSGAENGCIYWWNSKENDEYKKKFSKHSDKVTCLDIFRERNQLVSGSADRKVILWDMDSCSNLYAFSGHQDSIRIVRVSENFRMIYSFSNEFYAFSMDPKNMQKIEIKASAVEIIDSHKIAVGLFSGAIAIIDMSQNYIMRTYSAHSSSVLSIKYFPHLNLFFSMCKYEIKAWDVMVYAKKLSLTNDTNIKIVDKI